MTPVRVLYVLGRMDAAGVEVRVLDIMRRLSPDEFRVDICALSGLAGSLDPEVRALGGRVILLPLMNLSFAPRFKRLLREGRYDVMHSNVHYSSGLMLSLAAGAGTPGRVANFHVTTDGAPDTFRRRTQRRVMRHLIDRHATAIVGCCESVLEEAWSAEWRADPRCRAIYYGTDAITFEQYGDRAAVRHELGIAADARMFLHLGRVSADGQKNHGRLLAIFARLLTIVPSARLVLAGTGTEEVDGEIARHIRDLGIRDRVVTLGVRNDVPRLLAAADTLLLPSLFEGLPNVVLEACAAGVPVLASDLPGVREIASRLRLVRHLPLSAHDDEWAVTASTLPAEGERLRLRDRAADAFRASDFHVDRAVEAHRELWRSRRMASAAPVSWATPSMDQTSCSS